MSALALAVLAEVIGNVISFALLEGAKRTDARPAVVVVYPSLYRTRVVAYDRSDAGGDVAWLIILVPLVAGLLGVAGVFFLWTVDTILILSFWALVILGGLTLIGAIWASVRLLRSRDWSALGAHLFLVVLYLSIAAVLWLLSARPYAPPTMAGVESLLLSIQAHDFAEFFADAAVKVLSHPTEVLFLTAEILATALMLSSLVGALIVHLSLLGTLSEDGEASVSWGQLAIVPLISMTAAILLSNAWPIAIPVLLFGITGIRAVISAYVRWAEENQ